MTREQILERLIEFLDAIVPGEAQDLALDADLRDELDLDSMDFLQIVRAVHDELKVEIPELDYRKLDTLENFAAYLMQKMG